MITLLILSIKQLNGRTEKIYFEGIYKKQKNEIMSF